KHHRSGVDTQPAAGTGSGLQGISILRRDLEGDFRMLSRKAGLLLIAAAALFWLSWGLMPGAGVTRAAPIFDPVANKGASVMLSIVVQLISSALYVPA